MNTSLRAILPMYVQSVYESTIVSGRANCAWIHDNISVGSTSIRFSWHCRILLGTHGHDSCSIYLGRTTGLEAKRNYEGIHIYVSSRNIQYSYVRSWNHEISSCRCQVAEVKSRFEGPSLGGIPVRLVVVVVVYTHTLYICIMVSPRLYVLGVLSTHVRSRIWSTHHGIR